MKIDLTKSVIQNLLNLIDASNSGLTLTPAQVTFGALSAYSNSSFPVENTKVSMTAVAGSGYSGTQTIHYGRLTLAAEAASPSGAPTIPFGATDAQILAAIVAYYGFYPGEVSLNSSPVRPGVGVAANVNVTLKAAGSYLYLDGTQVLSIPFAAGKTVMLMHFDGANNSTTFTDAASTSRAFSIPAAGAVISTAQSKFGGSSFLSSTVGSAAITPDSPELRLTGPFTIEFFFNRTSTNAGQVMMTKGPVGSTGPARVQYDSGALFVYADQSSNTETTSLINVPAANFTNGVWQHIAVQKDANGLWTAWVDGVLKQSVSSPASTFGNLNSSLSLGNYANNNNPQLGYMDELRISNVARYTAAFTPPTAAFALD